MPAIGDIVNTPRGEGIVFVLVGAPEGGQDCVVLLKERNEVTGTPEMFQYKASQVTAGRSHPVYEIGQRVGYHGRGAVITDITDGVGDGLIVSLAIDNPSIGENPVARDAKARMPHWRLTMIEEFQTP